MPIISQFYGIVVSMYFNDIDKHHKPHVHIQYGEYACSFDFEGNLLAGNIPKRQRKLVEAWIEIHKEELIALWNVIQSGTGSFNIEPLK